MTKHKIDPEKFYKPKEIAKFKLFPWITNEKSIRNYIAYDLAHDNQLGATVKSTTEEGKEIKNGVRYFIKGENIIKILVKFEDGTLFEGK